MVLAGKETKLKDEPKLWNDNMLLMMALWQHLIDIVRHLGIV